MAQVELKSIWKRYGDVTAVENLDLTIEDRELLVLVGPSGCGKTTTLRMVAGLEEISDGTIAIGDRVVNDVAPKDRDIAMVFQSYALYPHMTVRDNMSFALKLRNTPKSEIDAQVHKTAEILGIHDLLERKPKQLSGGQRQRVAMGRAIVRNPRVFLFDEPLSNLDAKLRVQMRLEIARLHRELGATILYVTHDQVEAMTLADRIAVMKDGLLQQVGSPLELFDKPVNAFVASFIGSPSMNLLDAEYSSSTKLFTGDGFEFAGNGLELEDGGYMLGIRPQHLTPDPLGEGAGIEARVDVVEPLGSESFLYLKVGGRELVGRTDEAPPEEQSDLRFAVDTDHLHVFSADGSSRLN